MAVRPGPKNRNMYVYCAAKKRTLWFCVYNFYGATEHHVFFQTEKIEFRTGNKIEWNGEKKRAGSIEWRACNLLRQRIILMATICAARFAHRHTSSTSNAQCTMHISLKRNDVVINNIHNPIKRDFVESRMHIDCVIPLPEHTKTWDVYLVKQKTTNGSVSPRKLFDAASLVHMHRFALSCQNESLR